MRIEWLAPYAPAIGGILLGTFGYAAARYSRALGRAGAKRQRELREQAAE